MSPVNPKLQDDVLEILSKARAHVRTGNLDGEDSVSSLLEKLRDKGWKGFGNLNNFENLLEANGFTLREVHVGCGTRRAYVGI